MEVGIFRIMILSVVGRRRTAAKGRKILGRFSGRVHPSELDGKATVVVRSAVGCVVGTSVVEVTRTVGSAWVTGDAVAAAAVEEFLRTRKAYIVLYTLMTPRKSTLLHPPP